MSKKNKKQRQQKKLTKRFGSLEELAGIIINGEEKKPEVEPKKEEPNKEDAWDNW